MTKHDYWKTTDTDGEDAVYRQERINYAFDQYIENVGWTYALEDIARLMGGGEVSDLVVTLFDKLGPDQQERLLGMDK